MEWKGHYCFMKDISKRKEAEAAQEQYAERLQALSRRLLEVQEEERRHLARELHDEFGQMLAAITLHLYAAKSLAGEAALPRLEECATLLQQAGERVRSLALELRPTMLDTLGLEAALRWLTEQYQQRTGISVQVVGHLSGAPLVGEQAIACFRLAQEALTNVVRHAQAKHVWIELSQGDSVMELTVRDDGPGLRRSAHSGTGRPAWPAGTSGHARARADPRRHSRRGIPAWRRHPHPGLFFAERCLRGDNGRGDGVNEITPVDFPHSTKVFSQVHRLAAPAMIARSVLFWLRCPADSLRVGIGPFPDRSHCSRNESPCRSVTHR